MNSSRLGQFGRYPNHFHGHDVEAFVLKTFDDRPHQTTLYTIWFQQYQGPLHHNSTPFARNIHASRGSGGRNLKGISASAALEHCRRLSRQVHPVIELHTAQHWRVILPMSHLIANGICQRSVNQSYLFCLPASFVRYQNQMLARLERYLLASRNLGGPSQGRLKESFLRKLQTSNGNALKSNGGCVQRVTASRNGTLTSSRSRFHTPASPFILVSTDTEKPGVF